MENSKSNEEVIESMAKPVGISDTTRRSIESVAKPVSISDTMRKSIESMARPVGISDTMGKFFESMAKPVGISDTMRNSFASMARPVGISDTMGKFFESMAKPVGISDTMRNSFESMVKPVGISDTMRKSIESMARPVGINDTMGKFFESMAKPVGISEELRRSFEHTALLARNVDQSLSNMRISTPAVGWSHDDFEVPSVPEPPPNPIWETNSHLSELAGTVTQLVDVARQQAELSQAIRTSADLALKYAIQAGEDAKAATLLARKGVRLTSFAITVAIIVGLVSIAVSYRLSNSTDVRLKQEIQLLGDISRKLQQLNDRPVSNAVITSRPQTEAMEVRQQTPSKGSSLRH